MLKTYPLSFPNLPRLAQLNGFYCGPATLQMLCAFWGKKISQKEVIRASKTGRKIKSRGMTIEELGIAIDKLTPDLKFWSKYKATVEELSQLINLFKIPVGVEWQGIFDYPASKRFADEDDDPGHLAVITYLDIKKNLIKIADPDRHYAGRDRSFKVLQFERRWWDINLVTNPLTKKTHQQDDYHAMFILTSRKTTFPEQLGMK